LQAASGSFHVTSSASGLGIRIRSLPAWRGESGNTTEALVLKAAPEEVSPVV
jgi:hypothetical protein